MIREIRGNFSLKLEEGTVIAPSHRAGDVGETVHRIAPSPVVDRRRRRRHSHFNQATVAPVGLSLYLCSRSLFRLERTSEGAKEWCDQEWRSQT